MRLENGRTYLREWRLEALPQFVKMLPAEDEIAVEVAIIALARKFLGIIYRTLKNKWVFEDFSNFVLAEGA
jgi:hypothetical protein